MNEKIVPVPEAVEIILKSVNPMPAERISLTEATGRVLCNDVVAAIDIPYSDNSAMDGFAVRAKDTADATGPSPKTLRIVDDIPAGTAPKKIIGMNECAKIMTGGIMPQGANAVVMVEFTEQTGKNLAIIKKGVREKENVRFKGEDIKAGSTVLKKGKIIRAQEVGLLAAIGRSSIMVHQRPRIAVLSTGNEIASIDEPIGSEKVFDSNSYALFSAAKEAGGSPVQMGIVRDIESELTAKLEECLSFDIIITSGGVSVGEYDITKKILSALGGEMKFSKVAIKPGKPFTFGLLNGIPFFGLPGNPASAFVSFEIFVRPAILKMLGMKNRIKRTLHGTMGADFKNKPGRTHFVRAYFSYSENGEITVSPCGVQGSGIISSLAEANCLIMITPEKSDVKKGEMVEIIPMDNLHLLNDRSASK
ncbi:MAG TPA: gephyrin-like molybdotransferase Glp [bacterium]